MPATALVSPSIAQGQRTETVNRVVSLLLEGLALQSFCHDDNSVDAFNAKIDQMREELARIDDEDGAESSHELREHGDAAEFELTPRQKELEGAIAEMSDSLLAISRSSDAQSMALRQSERAVVSATEGGEIAAAAARLSVCLDSIRNQIHKKDDEVLAASLRYTPNDIDSITGLPNSRQALDALSRAWKHKNKYCAAVFGVRRLDSINARFGFQAGDDVLRVVAQHLAEYFKKDSLLFRWRGPCLLCIIEKKLSLPLIAAEVKRVAAARLQQTMMMKNREAIVAISMSCELISLETKTVEEATARIEQFITSQILEK